MVGSFAITRYVCLRHHADNCFFGVAFDDRSTRLATVGLSAVDNEAVCSFVNHEDVVEPTVGISRGGSTVCCCDGNEIAVFLLIFFKTVVVVFAVVLEDTKAWSRT